MRCYALILGLLLIPLATSSATTYVVCPDGTGDFPTIQAAIDAVVNGDTVELTDGTFTGEDNRDIDFGGKDIVVRSRSGDPTRCVLDCGSSWLAPHRGFFFHSGESSAARVEGVTISNGGTADYGGGIAIEFYSSPTIANCVIRDCSAEYAGGGLSCRESCDPVVIGCVFRNNRTNGPIQDINNHGGGMYCGHYCDVVLVRCTFAGNRAHLRGGGLHCHVYSTALLTNCTFYRNSSLNGANIDMRYASSVILDHSICVFGEIGSGVNCEDGCDAQVLCSDVYGNHGGDWVGCLEDQTGTSGNLWLDPLLCDPENSDFHLQEESPCAPSAQSCGLIGAWPVGCEDPAEVGESAEVAGGFSLGPIWPSPMTGSARVSYVVPQGSEGTPIVLSIHDLLGRRVRTLVDGWTGPGLHWIAWDGRDEQGVVMPAGTYFCRLGVGDEKLTRRVVVLR